MKKGIILLALPTLFLLNGCIIVAGGDWDGDENNSGWEQRQADNRSTLSQLNIGDSRTTVIEKMGEPDFSESFSHDSKTYQVYFYRTHKSHGDGKTTKDETTPVVFLDGVLFGWGDKALDQAVNINN